MVKAHIEFVKFCAFLNMCADTVQVEPVLVQQLAVCLFNQFLIDILQERFLSDDIMI